MAKVLLDMAISLDGFISGPNGEDHGLHDYLFISVGNVQVPLLEISAEDFLQPIMNEMRTQFLTTHAAARHMIRHVRSPSGLPDSQPTILPGTSHVSLVSRKELLVPMINTFLDAPIKTNEEKSS